MTLVRKAVSKLKVTVTLGITAAVVVSAVVVAVMNAMRSLSASVHLVGVGFHYRN